MSFNHSYSDSGLFGISASCAPTHVAGMLDVMCRELSALASDSGWARLKDGEVQRAKNQLRSNLLMNLESRMVELEDLGRQVQVHGRKVGVKEMCAKIEELTVEDLRRVARDTLLKIFAQHDSKSVQHTLYAMGKGVLEAVPEISEIELTMPYAAAYTQ